MESELLTWRDYFPLDDYSTICGWWIAHRHPLISEEFLPDTGIVVLDADDMEVCALWIYFDTSTPVCFTERAVTRPGLSIKTAGSALCFGVSVGVEVAKSRGYTLMALRVPIGMARYAKTHLGFYIDEREIANMSRFLMEEEIECHS
jgi:hypothetical protein